LSLMHYAYIIESLTTGKWYYGSSGDLAERLNHHNKGWNLSTRGRGPWKYIFLREFGNAEEAREFEFHLKKLRRKPYILSKYKQHFLKSD
jgi:putative endonuclease